MLDRTLSYIKKNNLLEESSKLLLAISGGIDSMVMLEIFRKSQYAISVAHCNFSLRDEESDKDQELVESYCIKHGIPFYSRRFNTREFAEEKGFSIQMAARDLRYSWFEECRISNSLDYIVLGHNRDDIIETFFINLTRGTGLKGLTGIKAKNNLLIRPLIYASREDIVKYASENNVGYREDSSNQETLYKRNKIRHEILPLIKEMNPSFSSSMESTIKRLEEAETVVYERVEYIKNGIILSEKGAVSIDIESLLLLIPIDLYIYELLKDYGVGQYQVEEIRNLLYSDSGKKVISSTHIILKDRNKLIISPRNNTKQPPPRLIHEDRLTEVKTYTCNVVGISDLTIVKDSSIAYLDYDKIKFPILIRTWKSGDWFYPLGMKGKKKLSDFFIDMKIPLTSKETIDIFLSDEIIFWLSGYRIDNRFAITDQTKKVLIISAEV